MSYTDNPIQDFNNYCAEQERELAKRPTCDMCGNPIVEDIFYEIEGDRIGECCIDTFLHNHKENTEDYIQ